jgi:predicted permease
MDPGFDAKGVLAFNLSLPPARYPTTAHRDRFTADLLRALRESIGGGSVAAALAPPFSGYTYATSFTRVDGDAKGSGEYRVVSDGYFRTLAIPVVEGREFAASDTDAALPVALVSRAMATQHWPNASPIGSRVTVGIDSQLTSRAPGAPRERVIVGVVEDVRHDRLGAPLAPTLYLPIAQQPPAFFTVMLRDRADALALVPAAKRAVALLAPQQPIEDLSSLEERIDRTVAQPRFYAGLLAAFAAIALVLASVGVYGVVSYFAAQREYDLGLHVALGAQPRDVMALVARTGLVPVAVGAVAGLLLSRTATRAIAHLLFAVEPTDPLVLGSATALLLAVAGAACLLPARRAARVDPLVTLRAQ